MAWEELLDIERMENLSPQEKQTALRDIPSNLAQSSEGQKLANLLSNFEFLQDKISTLSITELLNDYHLIADRETLGLSAAEVTELQIIQKALQLSEYVLKQDVTQLAEQLLGRLLAFNTKRIQNLLQQAQQQHQTPWLRPLVTCLIPPNSAIVNTLAGHQTSINSVVLMPDGKRIVSAVAGLNGAAAARLFHR